MSNCAVLSSCMLPRTQPSFIWSADFSCSKWSIYLNIHTRLELDGITYLYYICLLLYWGFQSSENFKNNITDTLFSACLIIQCHDDTTSRTNEVLKKDTGVTLTRHKTDSYNGRLAYNEATHDSTSRQIPIAFHYTQNLIRTTIFMATCLSLPRTYLFDILFFERMKIGNRGTHLCDVARWK